MNELVALLPMKAHSERVPGKNFRRLGARPLYAWMLDTLLAIPAVSRVVINTDAVERLAADPRTQNPRVWLRERPEALRGDFVSMNLVLADDIAAAPATTYLMTHVTNPFLSAATVAAALDAYRTGIAAGRADSLFSVTRHQTRFYRADGAPINHDPDNLVRTQDLEPWFEENSCLYLFSAASFAATNARIGRRPILFEIPRGEAVDIDDAEDWQLAEALATAAGRSQGESP
ncbi:MAG: acylneuraminate cytidylyltransferase family protein [Gammaproteobacteria bacterium]